MEQPLENPQHIRQEIIALGKFAMSDIQQIGLCKTKPSQLGFAYQLAFIKIRNYFPKQTPLEIDISILDYSAYQLNLVVDTISQYCNQRALIQQHQSKIQLYLKLKKFDDDAQGELNNYLVEQAHQTEQLTLLFPKAQCYLKENHILQPALSTLRRMIGSAREQAQQNIERRLVDLLSQKNKEKLLALLNIEDKRSLLWQIKQPPGLPSANALKQLIQRLLHIESMGILNIDTAWINKNYKQQLIRRIRYYSVTRVRSMPTERQLVMLLCLCHKLYEETIDYTIEMLIKLFDKAEKTAKKEIAQAVHNKRKEIKKTLEQFQKIADILLDDEISDGEVRNTIYTEIAKQTLQQQLDNTNAWLSGRYSHVFYLLIDRYGYFRKFFPSFIQAVDLNNDGTYSSNELLEAISLLKKLNEENNNQCPEDAPIDFIPKRLSKFIVDDGGNINRHAWETVLLKSIRDEIKNGNLSANKGRFFSPFDKLFMPKEHWHTKRSLFFDKANLPINASDIKHYLRERLHKSIDAFDNVQETNDYAKVENAKLVLSTDLAYEFTEEEYDALIRLKQFLKRNMRQIKLPDLLIEVDNDLHFTHFFMTYQQRQQRDKHAIAVVIAAIMAWGCGIGLSTMPHLVQGVTYDQLKAVTDYFLSDEDNQRYALREIVEALSALDITSRWGDGLSSGSDSIRMEFQSKVLQRGFSTCFGDYALEFYTFVADNYAPYFSKPIECTQRDAGHVLDGILYNATSLGLLEHYVDTHGYMEINYTGFTFFGKQLNPRIKNIKSQRLYGLDKNYS